MIFKPFIFGEEVARGEIAHGIVRLHHELRGEWGRDLRETVQSLFGIEVIDMTYFTSEPERLYAAGHDPVVTSYVDRLYGQGAIAATYEEVDARHKNDMGSRSQQTKAEPPDNALQPVPRGTVVCNSSLWRWTDVWRLANARDIDRDRFRISASREQLLRDTEAQVRRGLEAQARRAHRDELSRAMDPLHKARIEEMIQQKIREQMERKVSHRYLLGLE